MEYKATINDIKMSPQILKQELKDLKEMVNIYIPKTKCKKRQPTEAQCKTNCGN